MTNPVERPWRALAVLCVADFLILFTAVAGVASVSGPTLGGF